MNRLIRFLISIYHLVFRSSNRSCRYTPTCSEYLINAVEKYGTLKGLYLGIRRLLSCHPMSTRPFYDPA